MGHGIMKEMNVSKTILINAPFAGFLARYRWNGLDIADWLPFANKAKRTSGNGEIGTKYEVKYLLSDYNVVISASLKAAERTKIRLFSKYDFSFNSSSQSSEKKGSLEVEFRATNEGMTEVNVIIRYNDEGKIIKDLLMNEVTYSIKNLKIISEAKTYTLRGTTLN
jgi:hypothetical protein